MNCECPIERHFVDGSVSTPTPTGRWSHVCTRCGGRVHQTPSLRAALTDVPRTAAEVAGVEEGSPEALDVEERLVRLTREGAADFYRGATMPRVFRRPGARR